MVKENPWVNGEMDGKKVEGWFVYGNRPACFAFYPDDKELLVPVKSVIEGLTANGYVVTKIKVG